uniref:Uncharacterized protein n=1 Tax=Moniliophthora roreri TaxID=221103 RepID=A0A0W0ETS0_MONRR
MAEPSCTSVTSTQVTIKTELSSSKHKAHDTSPPQSSDPKGKKHAIDLPLNKGEQDNAGDMDIDELDPLQPSAIKSIQDLDLEEIIGGLLAKLRPWRYSDLTLDC